MGIELTGKGSSKGRDKKKKPAVAWSLHRHFCRHSDPDTAVSAVGVAVTGGVADMEQNPGAAERRGQDADAASRQLLRSILACLPFAAGTATEVCRGCSCAAAGSGRRQMLLGASWGVA